MPGSPWEPAVVDIEELLFSLINQVVGEGLNAIEVIHIRPAADEHDREHERQCGFKPFTPSKLFSPEQNQPDGIQHSQQ